MVFPVVMYGCESWTIKKAECRRTDVFELWCWRRLFEFLGLQGDPIKEISPGCSFSSVQSLSHVRLFATPRIAAHWASLSITNSWSSLKLMSIESVILSSHLILRCPLLLLSPILTSIRVFSNESTLHMRWPKYWSFHFSISPSNEHSGLISFRMDLLDVLAVQGTFKSLLQHHSSKAPILQCSTSLWSNFHIHT